MSTDIELIIGHPVALPKFALSALANVSKAHALERSALIGKVTDRDSKIVAVRVQQELKGVISQFEKARKDLKEPLLNAGRQLDSLVAAESLPLEKEFGRVSQVVKEFDDAERRRVQEEERLQRLELERIEREKQADIKRIADDLAAKEAEARRIQEEADRVALEAKLAAESMANAARNKKEAAIAEAHRQEALQQQAFAEVERQKQQAALNDQRAAAAAATAAIEDRAGDAAFAAAKPIEITTVTGQRTASVWNIVVTNPYELAKYHPDMVNITPRLSEIKFALNEGRAIRGITATREHVAGVRLPSPQRTIDV